MYVRIPALGRDSRRRARLWLLTLAMLAVVEAAIRLEAVDGLERLYYDVWHRLSGVRHQPRHVALVMLDDRTLAEKSDIPLVFWSPLFARASSILRQAGVPIVGIDFLFSVTAENWLGQLGIPESPKVRDYDLALRQEVNSGQVILAAANTHNPDTGFDEPHLPHRDYLLSIPDFDFVSHLGYANLLADADGGVRRFATAWPLTLPPDIEPGSSPRLTLGALLAIRSSGQRPDADGWVFGEQRLPADASLFISFAGPPGTVPRVSMSRLLAPDALNDPQVQALKGRVVIIGADYQGMNDIHFTPYGSAWMSGSEIQANVAETLLSGQFTMPVAPGLRILISVIVLALTIYLLQRVSPWVGLGVLMAAFALALALGWSFFQLYHLFPTASLQVGLFAAYIGCFGGRLTREQRERARMRQLFGRYVSDNVVNMLLESDKLPDLGGEAAEITVLFSDIRNFTTISEHLSPHDVVDMLNHYFQRVCEPILIEGGTIDKFIGDAVMVQFGSPVHFTDHAQRAVRAALAMRDIATQFREWMHTRFPDRGLPEFGIGIGIHTGVAVVGNIGSGKRIEYTAIGDTVNLASRLEGATKEVGCVILASAATVNAANGIVETGRHDVIHVKGRAQQVTVFEILALRQPDNPPQSLSSTIQHREAIR